MKKIIVSIVIVFTAWVVCAYQYGMDGEDAIRALLESGKMREVENIIQQEENKHPINEIYINTVQSHLSFYRGEYDQAAAYISKASTLSPHDGSMAQTRLFYSAVRDNAVGFVQEESEHFIIRLKGKDLILAPYLIESLEQSYRVLGKIFDHLPSEKIIVEVYPDKEQFSLSSTLSSEILKRSGAIGICKFHRLMILSPRALLMGYRWMDALSHELIHLLVNHVSGFNTPLWLHEGIARYYELKWRSRRDQPLDYLTSGARAQLMEAVSNDTLIAFKRMSPSLVYLKNQEEVSLAFSEVSSMVEYIGANYGEDAPIRLLKGLRKNAQEKNFKKVLGINERAIEKKWIKYMQSLPFEGTKGALTERYIFEKSLDEIEEYVGADVKGKVRLGDKFRRKGRFKVALIQYKQALVKEPDNPVILTKYARCLDSLGKKKDVEENLQKAIEKNPNYVTSYVLLANFLYREGRHENSLEYYIEANAINPFNPIIHKNMGLIFLKLNDEKKAQQELSIYTLLNPHDPEINYLLNTLEK